jgi:hypothetical protein
VKTLSVSLYKGKRKSLRLLTESERGNGGRDVRFVVGVDLEAVDEDDAPERQSTYEGVRQYLYEQEGEREAHQVRKLSRPSSNPIC